MANSRADSGWAEARSTSQEVVFSLSIICLGSDTAIFIYERRTTSICASFSWHLLRRFRFYRICSVESYVPPIEIH